MSTDSGGGPGATNGGPGSAPGPADPWATPPPATPWTAAPPPTTPPVTATPGVPGLPPIPPPPPYAVPPPVRATNGLAVASLVVSLIGLLTCVLGLPLGIVGLVLGILGLRRATARDEGGRGLAVAGIVIGGIAAALAVLGIVFVIWAGNQPADTAARDVVRTTLRNAASAQERYRATNPTYAPSLAELRVEDYRPADGVAVTIRWANAGGFCIEGVYGSATMYVTQDDEPAIGTCAFADRTT